MRLFYVGSAALLIALSGGVWLAVQTRSPSQSHEQEKQAALDEPEQDRARGGVLKRRPRSRRNSVHDPFVAIQSLMDAGRALDALAQLHALRTAQPELFADGLRGAWIAEIEQAAADELRATLAALPKDEARALLGRALGWMTDAAILSDLRRLAIQYAEGVEAKELIVISGAETDADRTALESHLERFGPNGSAAGLQGADARQLDALLKRLRARNAKVTRRVRALPIADALASERRRLEQLEKLRQRGAVGLLEHIHIGLAWLAIHQGEDGRFSDAATIARCKLLKHKGGCVETKEKRRYDQASTALGALAILDFRDQDARAVFEPALSAAVGWLRSQIRKDGSFPRHSYEAGIALMALGQAALSSGDPDIYADLKRAWAYYANNAELGPTIGYRYKPGQAGDLSVTGWYVQAYEAAVDAKADLPVGLRKALGEFVRKTWTGEKGFSYLRSQKKVRKSLESLGMLSMTVLDEEGAKPQRELWVERLAKLKPTAPLNLYSLYYDVRMELALRGDLSKSRRAALDDFAALHQKLEGNAAGRFSVGPDKKLLKAWKKEERVPAVTGSDRWIARGGSTLFTAFSILTLEHALYRR